MEKSWKRKNFSNFFVHAELWWEDVDEFAIGLKLAKENVHFEQ